MGDKRGKRGKKTAEAFAPIPPATNYDEMTPKFCLAYLQKGFDVASLPDKEAKAAFADALAIRAKMTWRALKAAPKHGLGLETIGESSIRAPIPEAFQDQEKFLVFRYYGKLPMAGVRILDVFHVIWIEPKFNDLYDHGS